MSPKALLIVLGVVAAGAIVVIQANNARPSKAAAPASSEPPPDALYLDVGPAGVILAGATRKGAARDAALDQVLGRWNGSEGWQGAIEAITTYRGRTALRLIEYDAAVLGGSYTILAVVGDEHGKEKGNSVRVQGCVAEVIVRPIPGGVTNQIVLDPARVVR
jgi:hypothetical protein